MPGATDRGQPKRQIGIAETAATRGRRRRWGISRVPSCKKWHHGQPMGQLNCQGGEEFHSGGAPMTRSTGGMAISRKTMHRARLENAAPTMTSERCQIQSERPRAEYTETIGSAETIRGRRGKRPPDRDQVREAEC